MTRNTLDDNTTLWAGQLNAIANGLAREAPITGIEPSKGTGDWEVDTTAGQYRTGSFPHAVSAQSPAVTLTAPGSDADMDAGESRIDIVTIDSTGTFAIQEGTAATNPTSPDIPDGETPVAIIHVENGDSTLADSDIFAYPAAYSSDVYDDEDPTADWTEHTATASGGGGTTATLVNVSGSGALMGAVATTNGSDVEIDVAMDGSTRTINADDGSSPATIMVGPVVYANGLTLTLRNIGGNNPTAQAVTL